MRLLELVRTAELPSLSPSEPAIEADFRAKTEESGTVTTTAGRGSGRGVLLFLGPDLFFVVKTHSSRSFLHLAWESRKEDNQFSLHIGSTFPSSITHASLRASQSVEVPDTSSLPVRWREVNRDEQTAKLGCSTYRIPQPSQQVRMRAAPSSSATAGTTKDASLPLFFSPCGGELAISEPTGPRDIAGYRFLGFRRSWNKEVWN